MDDPNTPEGADFEEEHAKQAEESQKANDGFVVADDELSKIAVAKALGFDRVSELRKYSDQVQRLVEYAHMKGSKDITGIISQLNALRNEVGMNKSIYNLSVYAGLALERARIEKEMEGFKGGD